MSRLRPPRHLVLSPHLDDAVLSVGGAIHRWISAGESVLVVTVMTGNPPAGELSAFAEFQHAQWDLPPREAYAVRRTEDRAALGILGANLAHLPFLDCIYRGGPDGTYYNTDDEIFGAVHPADAELARDLWAQFATLAPAGPDDISVYAPLGLGNHVDHQLVRRAAEAWLDTRLVYYEDYPYAEETDPATDNAELAPWLVPLSEDDLLARIEAVACYRSQIGVLFGGRDEMATHIRAYAASLAPPGAPAAERLWRPMV
jgi:LmbE family N-acetylglucosaminyl deacetylase